MVAGARGSEVLARRASVGDGTGRCMTGGLDVSRVGGRRSAVRERDPQTAKILGAAVEVHRTLGHGFLEAVYQRALCLELRRRQVPHVAEAPVPVRYKGEDVGCGYRADVVCWPEEDPVLLELKALKRLTDIERAQTLHYLRASGIRRGLLLNFGGERLEIQRLVNG